MINRWKVWISRKRIVSILLCIVFIISLLNGITLRNLGATEYIDWRKNDFMDINLNIVNNKAGDEDVFFQMPVSDAGTYTLEYYLEDGRKTTVTFKNTYSQMDIKFKVQEYDPLDPATPIERTQELMDLSFLDIDYTQQVPSWRFNATAEVDPITETLNYSILRSASARYPGVAFQMNNKKFIAKWDFQANILYVLFDGYHRGYIMPVTFTTPSNVSQTIKVLKSLEDFVISPTYLVDDGGVNVELSPVVHPNSNNDKPGNRPGLRINFKQPKELDPTTWGYQYVVAGVDNLKNVRAVFEISDIASADYLDFNMMLNPNPDTRIYEIPAENGVQTDPLNAVNYTYTALTNEYEVIIVEDKSTLNDQDTIIQWNDLGSSKIYNANIGFQIEGDMPDYEFATFYPIDNFAYTYLEYQLKRSDQQEAYIEITPYDVGTQDEIEYMVLYSKLIPPPSSPNLDPVNDLWIKHYESGGAPGSTINIPVPFRANSYQDAYQILVNFSNTQLRSQVLNYRAIDDLNVPPTTPQIVSIENLFVVPPATELLVNPTKIQFDLVWEAIENRVNGELDAVFEDNDGLSNDSIYYEVLVNDIPDISVTNPFQVFRVYEVYKDIDGLYKLRVHGNTTANDRASISTNYVTGYNSIEELFKMEKIVIYENDLWTPRIDTVYDEDADTYSITERTIGSHPTNYQTSFEFPGVNYIRIRAITETDGILGVSNYSVPQSLSLSILNYDIPIVEGITYEPFYSLIETDPMGVVLDWPAINISNYENNMLYPVDKEVSIPLGINYSVYLSEDKDALLNLKAEDTDYLNVAATLVGDVVIHSGTLDYLRQTDVDGKGNVVYYDVAREKDSTAPISSRIEGLDLNKTYYVRIVVKVNVNDTVGVNDEIRKGKPSSVLSLTTPIIPPEPGDDEIIPLAPENFTIEFLDDSQLSSLLQWTLPDEITVLEDTFGFEVFSIEDRSLPVELRSKEFDILDLYNHTSLEDSVVEAWRIIYEGTDVVLKKYDPDLADWVVQDVNLIHMTDTTVQIIDNNNSPNRVNYYYVRTINVLGGTALRASAWVQGSITTSPVKGPINLIVDYQSPYTYDGKRETIIRFDAPLPESADLNTEFVMEVYIKGETDIDYVKAVPYTSGSLSPDTYYSSYLGEADRSPVGYKRLYFKLLGLKPGKQYNIKVRIEDRTKQLETLPDGSSSYPKSPFSDKVTTRTEFSQEDYDKEVKYQQYIDYYLKKAEELKQNPYFQLETTSDRAFIKYRYNYADGLVRLSKGNTYELVVFNKKSNVYYLPSELIETANDFNVTYVIEPQNQEIAIRPYSMGQEITSEINTIIDSINAYGSVLEDYYVQINISAGDYNSTINGQTPSSPLVNIQMNVIGSKLSEENMDLYLENELDLVVGNRKNELIELLDKELKLGINDTKLTYIVQSVLSLVETDFYTRGQDVLEANLDNTSYPIKTLSKAFTVGIQAYQPNDNNVLYSKTTGDWKVETASYYNNRYHIESKVLGSFMSVSRSGSTELSKIYTTTQLSILNKYALTELFTSTELKTPTGTMLNTQMIRTFARLLGSGSLNDTGAYMNSLGISVPTLNEFSTLDRSVASYLYVQVYAKKHQINLASVVITNYNAIEDITSVPLGYRNTLLKGVSLGIIDLVQNQLMPTKKVTLGEFFQLIDNIE